jgi:hypothetical protein
LRLPVSAGAGRWIRWTTIGCVALLALIAETVSYLHMHMLGTWHGLSPSVAAWSVFNCRRHDPRRARHGG